MNRVLDRLPRTRFGRYGREVPAFRTCGVAGFYAAVVVTLGGGLLAGLSLVVLALLCAVCGLSFFAYAFARRFVTGRETLVLLEYVWFAEICVAATVWGLGLSVLDYLDAVAVGLCFFLAAGRVGCLLVGCCYGRPAAVGIRYGREAARDGFPRELVGVRLFPVPALEAAGLLVIGCTGLAALPSAPSGAVFTWFLVSYAVLRFGLEGLRGDARPRLLGLSVNRWMCLAEFGLALWLSQRDHPALTTTRVAIVVGLLVALLVAALAVMRAGDRGRRLLSDDHVAELRRLAHAMPTTTPVVTTSSLGVIVAVSGEHVAESSGLHVSFSPAAHPIDLRLLCELAARCLPDLDPTAANFTRRHVLHVFVPEMGQRPPHAPSGDKLYGNVVRLAQRLDAEEEIGSPPNGDSNGNGDHRMNYFGSPSPTH